MSDRRRFSNAEREQIYAAAAGRCAHCGAELGPGWHADHIRPYSHGGPTDLANAQALCEECNRRKGTKLDTFELRPFQREIVATTQARIARGERKTVAWIETGSGKTWAWQALADALKRDGVIDYVATYTPRTNLCVQADADWRAFDARIGGAALDRVGNVANRNPLLADDLGGLISTYQAAVAAPSTHIMQAQAGRGRFLLVLDEAQFCGYGDDGGGTQAGHIMRQLGELAAHVLVLTGTPYRADGERVVFCEYGEPDGDGRVHLIYDVQATYEGGVGEGYLRPFEFRFADGRAIYEREDGRRHAITISENGDEHLRELLRDPDVYGPIVDRTLSILRDMQRHDARYRALLACMDTEHATDVDRYVRERHADLRGVRAAAKDGQKANATLRSFREQAVADVLTQCRLAFIGFDHKPITVVGLLTHYRHEGHLRQLIGRGLRMWPARPVAEQTCWVVGPEDLALVQFATRMKDEAAEGLRQRSDREQATREATMPLFGRVTDAEITSERAFGFHGEVAADELSRLDQARQAAGIAEPVTKLRRFLDELNGEAKTSDQRAAENSGGTYQEDVDARARRNQQKANKIAGARLRRGHGTFEQHITEVLNEAHRRDGWGYRSDPGWTLDRLDARYETLCDIERSERAA